MAKEVDRGSTRHALAASCGGSPRVPLGFWRAVESRAKPACLPPPERRAPGQAIDPGHGRRRGVRASGRPFGGRLVSDEARNPGSRISPGAGRQTRPGVSLTGYGPLGHVRPLAAASPRADKQRVEYRRGPVTEWYENRPGGLEQGFTI